jgi:hypothetical protein
MAELMKDNLFRTIKKVMGITLGKMAVDLKAGGISINSMVLESMLELEIAKLTAIVMMMAPQAKLVYGRWEKEFNGLKIKK